MSKNKPGQNPKGKPTQQQKPTQAPAEQPVTQEQPQDSEHAEYHELKNSMSPEERRAYIQSIKKVNPMDQRTIKNSDDAKVRQAEKLAAAQKKLAEKSKAAESGTKIEK